MLWSMKRRGSARHSTDSSTIAYFSLLINSDKLPAVVDSLLQGPQLKRAPNGVIHRIYIRAVEGHSEGDILKP